MRGVVRLAWWPPAGRRGRGVKFHSLHASRAVWLTVSLALTTSETLRTTQALEAGAEAVRALIDEGRYDWGPVTEVLTPAILERIYDIPVVVDRVAGSSVVVVRS